MEWSFPPLYEALAEVPDFRSRQGRRHPLPAVLALACAATLAGCRSYSAIAEWGRLHGAELAGALGFKRSKTPSVGTLFTIFSQIDREALERVLSDWSEKVVVALPARTGEIEGVSIDGKELRGSAKQGATGVHLLSAFSHRLGLTLGQVAVGEKTNETKAIGGLLSGLVIEGRLITVDAMHTLKPLAEEITDKGGST